LGLATEATVNQRIKNDVPIRKNFFEEKTFRKFGTIEPKIASAQGANMANLGRATGSDKPLVHTVTVTKKMHNPIWISSLLFWLSTDMSKSYATGV
jgi:hypothetical protein